jgi:hypothetical protein
VLFKGFAMKFQHSIDPRIQAIAFVARFLYASVNYTQ